MKKDKDCVIIGLAGPAGSGKSTIAAGLCGYLLKLYRLCGEYTIKNGELYVRYNEGIGDFVKYGFSYDLCKIFHFADSLKEACHAWFNIPKEFLYGTQEDKEKFSGYYWEGMPDADGRSGPMSVREFMQFFGTNVIRKINKDAFVNATLHKVEKAAKCKYTKLIVIPDCRFVNEMNAIQNIGGYVCKVKGNFTDQQYDHESEKEHHSFLFCDYIIHNNKPLEDVISELIYNLNLYRL